MFNLFFAKIHKKNKISARISEIFIIFANAFYRRKPEGLSGWVWLLWNRAFANVRLRLLVNFATLPIVGRGCDNGECSRWVYRILLRIVVYISQQYVLVSCMTIYSYMESSYTITWAFCIVRLFQLGQCEGLRVVGWARRIPRFRFIGA